MLDAILDGHVVAAVLRERTFAHGFSTWHGILAAELVERVGKMLDAKRFLRDGDIAVLLAGSLPGFLLHFDLDNPRLVIRSSIPLENDEAERLLGELVNLILIIGASDGVQHILVVEPQVPRPNHGIALAHGDDGVASPNLVLRYVELHELTVGRDAKGG